METFMEVMQNFILHTDGYKLGHWNMYPEGTETVYSYFESREGAAFPHTVFYGLQYLLKRMEGSVVTWDGLSRAFNLSKDYFGTPDLFNYKGWSHIIEEHGGRLPLRIKAVSEGTPVPTGNVLMTVENTDPKCFWLTNAVESYLTHVWYPSTVATLSRTVKEDITNFMKLTADPEALAGIPFMLHDFGYRGAAMDEASAIGGSGHLLNFVGTDTLLPLLLIQDYYNTDAVVGASVPATEHSQMTALGQEGEYQMVDRLLEQYPMGILSVVGDSYNIYKFVREIGTTYKERILARDGVFVIRPDSITRSHKTPAELVVYIAQELAQHFGTTINSRGYKVINPHVRILWGDGLDRYLIHDILVALEHYGFSAENIVAFGMGGGLLQKINRDTQRFAFKSSAQKRDGEWHDVWKDPVDSTKKSKRGRLKLIDDQGLKTVAFDDREAELHSDLLQTVFEDGQVVKEYTFEEVRECAKL